MYLTTKNASAYVGKVIDAKCRRFHHYPLRIHEKDGSYYYSDATGTWMRIPTEDDTFNSVQFDFVIDPAVI